MALSVQQLLVLAFALLSFAEVQACTGQKCCSELICHVIRHNIKLVMMMISW